MAELKYEITEKIGVLSENAKGWTKELNMVSWNEHDPKYDIREWALNHERRIFHKTGVRIAVCRTDSLDEGEDVIANHAEHVLRTGVLEDRPAHVVIRDVAVVVVVMPSAFGEDGVLETVTPHGCVRLFLTLFVVQHLHEEQIGHLLQDVHGVRHTGCPEHIPNTVNLILNLACNHIENE